MYIRNIFFVSLILSATYYLPSYAGQTQTNEIESAQADEALAFFSEDDAFADVNIDLNCKPQQLPIWKQAGAWLFIKMYWPIKRALTWWDGSKLKTPIKK